MVVTKTKLKGCLILQPKIIKDVRGYFFETYNEQTFRRTTELEIDFVQENESHSSKGVLRGIHYQLGKFAQAKLIRVVRGKVLDIIVDLRSQSPTLGEYLSIELSEENKTQVFIPRGFGHGFLALEDNTIFSYKCDNFYNRESETGIIFNDKDLNIDWALTEDKLIISDKDLLLPSFKNAKL